MPTSCTWTRSFGTLSVGLHSVYSFWPRRFLIDPKDPHSGPTRVSRRLVKPYIFLTPGFGGSSESPTAASLTNAGEMPQCVFLLSFASQPKPNMPPFLGGQLICPGRVLAKNVMIFAIALLTRDFDLEVLTKEIKFSKRWFGFGTEIPEHAISIRMRRNEPSSPEQNSLH